LLRGRVGRDTLETRLRQQFLCSLRHRAAKRHSHKSRSVANLPQSSCELHGFVLLSFISRAARKKSMLGNLLFIKYLALTVGKCISAFVPIWSSGCEGLVV